MSDAALAELVPALEHSLAVGGQADVSELGGADSTGGGAGTAERPVRRGKHLQRRQEMPSILRLFSVIGRTADTRRLRENVSCWGLAGALSLAQKISPRPVNATAQRALQP